MKDNEIRQQSEQAYQQWCKQWREHAKIHSKYKMKSLADYENSGIGRACLIVANGYSFEQEIETIKKYQHNVDILCCDKTLGHLIDHGINPTFCMVCDANVNYEKYMKPWEEKLQDTVLFMNVCANPKWSKNGNWKDCYFFANKDILGSEKEFMELSGCPNVIPAGTNVSNAMVILMSQSDNAGKRNFFGYDKYLLIGFDYCWRDSYYAFDRDGGGKTWYMRHNPAIDINGNWVYTSSNLTFSARWLAKYLQAFNILAVQCSKMSMLGAFRSGDLAEQMQYGSYNSGDSQKVIKMVEYLRKIQAESNAINQEIERIGQDHYNQVIRTV